MSTNLLAVVLFPLMTILAVEAMPLALMLAVVSIVVAPLIKDVPDIVPSLITGAVKVLLLKVWLAVSVTTTPEVGNVAVELTPVPPRLVGKMPVTDSVWLRSIALKYGVPPSAGTVKLWKRLPAAVELSGP